MKYGITNLIFLIALILTGCKSMSIVNASQLKLKQDFCVSAPTADYHQLPAIPGNADSLLNHETQLSALLTQEDILVANASGTLQLIKDILRPRKDSTTFNEKLFMEYAVGIQKNISFLESQIDAISAELQCETFRTRQLSAYLGNLNAKRTSRLTVGAIAVGSLTTILPVFVTSKTPQNIVAISGGVVAAGLGALTLKPGRYALKMMTYRNLLENIWQGNNATVMYPPGLWYLLNESRFGNSPGGSKAQVLKTRWLKFELNNSLDKATEQLLFGNGGVFNQDNLDIRATMLSELTAEVNSLHQYLRNLSYKIDAIKLQVLQAAHLP